MVAAVVVVPKCSNAHPDWHVGSVHDSHTSINITVIVAMIVVLAEIKAVAVSRCLVICFGTVICHGGLVENARLDGVVRWHGHEFLRDPLLAAEKGGRNVWVLWHTMGLVVVVLSSSDTIETACKGFLGAADFSILMSALVVEMVRIVVHVGNDAHGGRSGGQVGTDCRICREEVFISG